MFDQLATTPALVEAVSGLIGIAAGVGIPTLGFVIYHLFSNLPPENREYLDELPLGLRLIWPLVRLLEHYVCARYSVDSLYDASLRLGRTGMDYLLNPEQYYALKLVSLGLATLFGWVSLHLLKVESFFMVAVLGVLGYFYPTIWLKDVRARRRLQVTRSLPIYLDFLTMAVEAGLNFSGALSQAVEKGPPGALRNEFSRVARDIKAGLLRADALRRMAARLDLEVVTALVTAIIQAERMGSSLGSTLRIQAEQRRRERFQLAEKKAMEAPVKLVGPLVLFIFPVTFIVLAFPIVMKFLHRGGL